MVFHFKLSRLFLAILCVAGSMYAENQHNQHLSNMYEHFSIPVEIAHVNASKKSVRFHMQSHDGFEILAGKHAQTVSDTTISVTVAKNMVFINGKKILEKQIKIVPCHGSNIYFQDRYYAGSLVIETKRKSTRIKHYDAPLNEERVACHYANQWKKDIIHNVHTSIDVAETSVKKINKSTVESVATPSDLQAQQFTVRVLLAEQELPAVESWHLESKHGFIISDPKETEKKIKIDAQKITVKMRSSGSIYINGKRQFQAQALIKPVSGSITFQGKEYQGTVWILVDQGKAMLINCLGIEDYVACVLRTESWPGWPLEVNKVFAIASRTYVIAMVKNASNKRPYHVKNSNVHQTYTGGNASSIIKQAVEETRGVFLTYKNQPIIAMFDACCGGVIPANIQGVDFVGSPYLARKKACTYCKVWKIYSWEASYDLANLESVLKKEFSSLKKLKEIKITKKDKAGLVQELSIKSASKSYKLTGKKLYSLLAKGVKSFYHSVSKNGNKITFKGQGYGHHLGLCQWGAREMVNQGWEYKDILSFYYPGTNLMRLL